MSDVKWLLVGAGDIAHTRVAPALVAARDSKLVAICDIRQARASELAAQHGVRTVYSDYAQALAESGADTVYIATPQPTHVEFSLQALAAGKHFLCEKPLGLNGAECLKLLAAARQTDRITSCSNYRRLSEQYKVTEAMIRNREIGTVTGGWMVYSTPSYYDPGNSRSCKALGGGPIKEYCFYVIDIAVNLFGMPASVMAQASIFRPGRDIEDIAVIIMRFPGGALFTITVNNHSPGVRHELELFGSEGRVYWPEWPPHGNGPVLKITRNGTERLDTRTETNYHLPMVQDFVDCVLEGRQPVCTLESAVKTEIVTDAIYRSAASGKLEPVVWED